VELDELYIKIDSHRDTQLPCIFLIFDEISTYKYRVKFACHFTEIEEVPPLTSYQVGVAALLKMYRLEVLNERVRGF
jgi:hypothetical protein